MSVECPQLHKRIGKFYADSGADISIVKIGELAPGYPIDAQRIIKIQGVTEGTAYTLGQAEVQLGGLRCYLQAVSNDFPIENSGIIGWDIIDSHGGCVDALSKSLKLGNTRLPFDVGEQFTIPPRVKMAISAPVINNDVEVRWVPLNDLHPDLLFGNFISDNVNGRVYAECINVSDSEVTISASMVELQECEIIANPLFQADEDGSAENVASFTANLRRMFDAEKREKYREVFNLNRDLQANAQKRHDRVEKIMKLADLEGCNEEEKNLIREIVDEFAGVFGLDGDPLPATHLLQHKIVLKSNRPIRNHRFRFPPAIKEHMLRELAKLREQDIVVPSNSNYSSSLWIVPKKPDADGNKRFRLVTDFRGLNEETEGSCHPLPFTSDILEHLASANYITVMDLKSGYHQIEMHPDSAHLTVFIPHPTEKSTFCP